MINFLIVAFVLFMLIRQMNKLVAPTPATAAAPPPSEEALLLPCAKSTQSWVKRPVLKPAAAFALLLLAALPALCLFAPIPARADDAMTAAANNFYTQAAGISRGGGIPDAQARAP